MGSLLLLRTIAYYRYSGAIVEEATTVPATAVSPSRASSPAKAPVDWATCEACGYMGPRAKFEYEDALGKRGLRCPNCRESSRVTFTLV